MTLIELIDATIDYHDGDKIILMQEEGNEFNIQSITEDPDGYVRVWMTA